MEPLKPVSTNKKVKLSGNRIYFNEGLKDRLKMQNGQEYGVYELKEGAILLIRLTAGELPE